MLKKMTSILGIILLIGTILTQDASANDNFNFRSLAFKGVFGTQSSLNWPQPLALKTEQSYSESKDTAIRTGTENWEQPQWSFFVVPGIFIGLALLVLFFNRKK